MLPKEVKLKMDQDQSLENVLDCVLPYIHDGDDRNSISLVSRRFYDLDSLTRKHLTVHAHYGPNPSYFSQRFPSIESLTLKGIQIVWDFPEISDIDVTPWIEEIAVQFKRLKALSIRGMDVFDHDLKLLAKTRGKDLQSLKICFCKGFSMDGLIHVSKYCNDLRTLCLSANHVEDEDRNNGKWLRQLGLHNKVIQSLHSDFVINDVNDLTLIAKQCSSSLVSLKIWPNEPLNHLGDVFSHATKLEDFDGVIIDEHMDYSSFKFPPSIRGLGIQNSSTAPFLFLPPFANQLRELNLTRECCHCFLIRSCPNLEVLRTDDVCGDTGLRVIAQVCKKLRKLTQYGRVTHMGLIALVKGCTSLEYLDVKLSDISNEAIESVGTHLKNLRDFRMDLLKKAGITFDNGIRALLIGCSKLRKLHINLSNGGLTDVGVGYIGKYGRNLRSLFLGCTGVSDAGLIELSNGCPSLRKLNLENCPFSKQVVETFVFNIRPLRYVRVKGVMSITHPDFTAEVLPELQPYVTLAKKLRRLAVQLVADGSGVGSVKISFGETDDVDPALFKVLVAKGICVKEERALLDRAPEKPLEIIKVQIANVKSRLAVAISDSGVIEVEGRVKDGVPELTKIGALDVVVSLKENVIICTQAFGVPVSSVPSILDADDVIISSMSFSRMERRTKQAVTVIGVNDKPSRKALKEIAKVYRVKKCVFLAL